MSTGLKVELTPGAAGLLQRSKQWPRAVTTLLVRALDQENELTVGHIVQERATGTGPFPPSEGKLGVRTSRYRRSIRRARAAVSGTSIQSSIGSNVRYAGAHEFGFKDVVSVKAHGAQNRALDVYRVRGGNLVQGWELAGAGGKGKRVAMGFVTVRAHQVKMNIPARAPIRRGIEDRLPIYRTSLSAAIVAAFAKGAT